MFFFVLVEAKANEYKNSYFSSFGLKIHIGKICSMRCVDWEHLVFTFIKT